MSKKANPALIGTFVIGAIFLVIAAILVLGNLKFNKESYRCVLYFNGSLHGLDVGAPVTYRGVRIGQVGSIEILFDRKEKNYHIPVYVDINGNGARLQDNYREAGFDNPEDFFESLIHRGLQAKLKMSSLITGKLYIEFTFDPESTNAPIIRQGEYLQIPTAPSGLEQFTQAIESLPLKKLMDRSMSVLNGMDKFINDPDLHNSVASFNTAVVHFDGLVAGVDKQLASLDPEISRLLADLSSLTANAEKMLSETNRELQPTIKDMRKTLARVSLAADRLVTTLDSADTMAAENSELPYQLGLTLAEVRKAARAMRDFADYLQRHPNALLVGPEEDGK